MEEVGVNEVTQRYFNVNTAAEYLGMTVDSLRDRVRRGTIPFIREGHRIFFDATDLDRHMKARKTTRTQPHTQEHSHDTADRKETPQ